ncbi:pentatricopeptide (PPR) repeat-containing protein [Striga asiatica]|uniref:Pentatricopeptide (PPR) repeat-containing protein n=1 Tax=Striga asiatica TaxID=4170 RepID=A0A5A7PNU3_STRAF|nr:pentatricopeptide (PPR) repeat-containing protein [Striga asiatica]
MMRLSYAFFLWRFLSSSPIRHESGKSLCCSQYSLHSRCFCTKGAVAKFNFREEIKNINGLDDALCLYENMSRTRPLPCVVQFTQLLSRVVNLKEYSAAINLFKDICSLGVSVNEYTMNIAINSLCLSGRVDYGFSVLGWFFKLGCSADGYTFNTLLKGLFREKMINEAQELIRKMVGEGLCELNVVTCGIVVDGLCKVGNTSMAIEFLRTMEKGTLKPNAYIYSIVIDGLCKDRMIDSALALFNEMPKKDILPNVVTYSSLILELGYSSSADLSKGNFFFF